MEYMEYIERFPLDKAYSFLEDNGFAAEASEIKYSTDRYKSYISSLRRAKILRLVKAHNLFDKFCNEIWPSGLTDRGKRKIIHYENIYSKFTGAAIEREEEIEGDDEVEEREFAFESDLQNFLIKNLDTIEKGLKLYEDSTGVKGIEFYVPGTSRRIDIYAVDKEGTPTIIELKVSKGHERVIGQLLYYRSKIKDALGIKKVRSIIIAKEITEELKYATREISDIELFEYQMSFNIKKV
jgi:hypothetical protein